MRLDLEEEDLWAAVHELARREPVPAGQLVTHLPGQALAARSLVDASHGSEGSVAGFEPFPALTDVRTTNEQVDRLREIEGI